MKKTLAAALVVAVAAAVAGLQALDSKGYFGSRQVVTQDVSPLDESLSQLRQQQGSRDTRLNAARFIASNAASVTPDLVHQLSQPLLKDGDAAVRKEVAEAMRQLAARHCDDSQLRPAQFEPQMLEILLAAFNRENDATVRINIVKAAGEMNHPDALLILDKAAADNNPAVREAAQGARRDRERRMLAARSG